MSIKAGMGALALVVMALTGCDQSKAELETTKQQLTTVTSERDALKSQLDAAKTQLAAAQQQIDQLKAAQAAAPAAAPAPEPAAPAKGGHASKGPKVPEGKPATAKEIRKEENKRSNTGGSGM
jgi:septal ring factor EnvC (AmiA/AmiB activator)